MAQWLKRWFRKPEHPGLTPRRAHFAFSRNYTPTAEQWKSILKLYSIPTVYATFLYT